MKTDLSLVSYEPICKRDDADPTIPPPSDGGSEGSTQKAVTAGMTVADLRGLLWLGLILGGTKLFIDTVSDEETEVQMA